jgi:hypothetical protein
MITTVYKSEFHDYFTRSDTYKNQFSYEAREIIFDYLEEYEASTGENVEFDLVAICCDFAESTIEELIFDYGYMMDQEAEKSEEYIEEFLTDNTQLCGSYTDDQGVKFYVYAQF